MKYKKHIFIIAILIIMVVLGLYIDFHIYDTDAPSSSPAGDQPKTLISSSEWEETDGENTYVYRTETYIYDES